MEKVKNSGLIISLIKKLIKENPEIKKTYGHIPVIFELEIYQRFGILISDFQFLNEKLDENLYLFYKKLYLNNQLLYINDYRLLYSIAIV